MAGRLSKVNITSEFPGYCQCLSQRLYRVLEDIGASIPVRDIVSRTMRTDEILQSLRSSIDNHENVSWYIFGSSSEGTTTQGLKSDVDSVIVHENLPVMTNLAEAQQSPVCLLLVQDSHTPPGYAKLQLMAFGVPVTETMAEDIFSSIFYIADTEGRLVYTLQRVTFPATVKHGPAVTIEETYINVARDLVLAVRSLSWPDCASEWLVRERHYNWPSQEQIDKCKTLGCFFVQVGHPKSDEYHLQWRISFSLQERLLVTDFNSVQLKCYILLKMMKKERVHKSLGEKSLTSYHFKTCMLYMIENTPGEFWTEKNLLVCLHHCVHQMFVWAETGVCPNYFIPEENMFDGRVFGQLRIRTCEILRQILSSDFKFLLSIKTDMLGVRFQEVFDSGRRASRYGQTVFSQLLKPFHISYISMLNLRSSFFANCQSSVSSECVQELCKVKHGLLGTNRVSEHSVTETREALSLLLPYIDITLMSVKLVEAKHMSASTESILDLLTSERWHAVSLETDSFSAKLKQASAMCMLACCELSLEILQGLQERLDQQITVCGCYHMVIPTLLEKSPQVISGCSYEEMLHQHFLPCVVYLPAERDLTPPALCYEMDRSAGFPTEGRKHWHDWAVVDGKILFYFLLYLNHHHLGMEANALADIASIWGLILTKPLSLSHFETALNIIGWIHKERGLTALAKMCLLESLSCQPTHNAASLHLRDVSSIM